MSHSLPALAAALAALTVALAPAHADTPPCRTQVQTGDWISSADANTWMVERDFILTMADSLPYAFRSIDENATAASTSRTGKAQLAYGSDGTLMLLTAYPVAYQEDAMVPLDAFLTAQGDQLMFSVRTRDGGVYALAYLGPLEDGHRLVLAGLVSGGAADTLRTLLVTGASFEPMLTGKSLRIAGDSDFSATGFTAAAEVAEDAHARLRSDAEAGTCH